MTRKLLHSLNTLADKLNDLDKQIIEYLEVQKVDQAAALVEQRNKLINIMTAIYNKVDEQKLPISLKELLLIVQQKINIILQHNDDLLTQFNQAKENVQTEILATITNRKKIKGYNFTSRHL